jgi:multisubunit Na+/H+ antiporter MnhG subunit
MAVSDVVVPILLGVGVLAELVCCLGLALADDVFGRLHFLAGAGTVGAAGLTAAVLVEHGLSGYGIKALLVLVALLGFGPVLAHAIAHMARIRERGGLEIGPEELME